MNSPWVFISERRLLLMNNNKNESRTPGRKLKREDLAKVTGANRLMLGCCTQGCCGSNQLEPSSPSN
jgi:hypothetical protein